MKKKVWDMILLTVMMFGCGGLLCLMEDVKMWVMRLELKKACMQRRRLEGWAA